MIYTPLLCQGVYFSWAENKLWSHCSRFHCYFLCAPVAEVDWGVLFFLLSNDPACEVPVPPPDSSGDLSPSAGRLLHVLPPECNIPDLPLRLILASQVSYFQPCESSPAWVAPCICIGGPGNEAGCVDWALTLYLLQGKASEFGSKVKKQQVELRTTFFFSHTVTELNLQWG